MPESCQNAVSVYGGALSAEWITPGLDSAGQIFSSAVSVGICGNATEMPLMTAVTSLEMHGVRADADLSVIVITDEDDRSPASVAHYVQRLQSLRNRRDYIRLSALAVLDPEMCENLHSESTAAPRLGVAVDLTGGLEVNLCSEDLDSDLQELSRVSARLKRVFPLSVDPDPRSLLLSVDGEVVSCESRDLVWTYGRGEGLPYVAFASPPPLGAVVTIEYSAGSGDPSLFCGEP